MGGRKLPTCQTIFFLYCAGTPLASHPGRLFWATGMKIAILHYSVPPIVGGVESVIAHHARWMSADGHSVRLIAARGEPLSEQISLITMPLADSRHERVLQVKQALDRGEVTNDFEVVRDKLAIELQTAVEGIDIREICSL